MKSNHVKYRIILFLFYCLLSSANASGKPTFTVEIQVNDDFTGDPIANVEVHIEQTGEKLFTDSLGKIYLKDLSEQRLTIHLTHSLYQDQDRYEYFKKRQRKDKNLTYRMYPSRELLNQYFQPIIEEEIAEMNRIDSTHYLPCDQDSTPTYVKAHFPGGMQNFQRYIVTNLNYPEESIEMDEQGKVYMSFVIEKDGTITNVKVERGVSKLLDRESKRLIREMPNWVPSYCNGRPESALLRIPLIFTLN